MFNTILEASAAWQAHKQLYESAGIFPGNDVVAYVTPEVKRNYLAMDAQPTLFTQANSAIPAFLTTMIDPDVYKVLFAPTKGAEILGEVRKGTWVDQTAMFPVVEATGEASSYGDYNENGRAGANMNWPQRQSYLFQTICEYGELEVERAGLGRVNWVSEVDGAGVQVLNRSLNQTYFYGVRGLQNYGILNDPNLNAALTPSLKAYGGVKWVNNGQIVATANEVFADIQAMFYQLISQQTQGLVDQYVNVTLALSPGAAIALTATNAFGVNVGDLLKKNFPNIKIVTAVQYGAKSTLNPVGAAAGETVQMIAANIEGQETGYAAFNEKLRAHPIVRALSSWKKKMTSGSWGAVIRMPAAIATMVGV